MPDPTNSNAFMLKSKTFFWTFSCISRICIKLKILWKARWASEVIFFWNYRLQIVALPKRLKGPSSAHLWTVHMLKGPKDCLNLHGSIFVIFFVTLERSQSKTSVLVVSQTLRLFSKIMTPDEKYSLSVKASVYLKPFKCNYLQTKKYILMFFEHLRNLHEIWNTLNKNISLRGDFFLKL